MHARRWLADFDTDALDSAVYDVVVVGSGIAGLTAALRSSRSRRVALVTKARLSDTSTWYAQGGIAGAVGEADSVELHVADTMVVGQGLCDRAVVSAVVEEAPAALRELRDMGMRFDLAEGGELALAREGGHSLPRVLHSGDSTGAAVQETLTRALVDSERVDIFERRFLVDLLVSEGICRGALLMDEATGRLEALFAGAVVLATGGAGQVFPVTTNPAVATGDGVAAAWRAGAEIADMEFVQFHPTALDHQSAPRFLVSEALRGEGAYLLDCDEQRFMLGVHPLAELAPRDVVSREIEQVMARCGRANVWLDARHLGAEHLRTRFPNIWQACADAGYDLSADLVPVVPAAHYLIGGVRIDPDGRSSLPGLYASGEVTASGLHGANRLASNSLLEGLVFSRRIARALDIDDVQSRPARITSRDAGEPAPPAAAADTPAHAPDAAAVAERVRTIAGAALGMSRQAVALERAIEELDALASSLEPSANIADLESVNLACVAALTASAALARQETRGCHSRIDFPMRDDERLRGHFVWRRGVPPVFVALRDTPEGPA